VSKKPISKKTLTIHFDTQVGLDNFVAWYSNSGEQDSGYYEKTSGSDWIYVKPPEDACPSCEYSSDNNQQKLWDNKQLKVVPLECTNCGYKWNLKNYYK
jgi:hypothetical protein